MHEALCRPAGRATLGPAIIGTSWGVQRRLSQVTCLKIASLALPKCLVRMPINKERP